MLKIAFGRDFSLGKVGNTMEMNNDIYCTCVISTRSWIVFNRTFSNLLQFD